MTFDIWQADLVLERVAVVRQNANNLYHYHVTKEV